MNGCRLALAIALIFTVAGCADPVRKLRYGKVIAKQPVSLESTFGDSTLGYRYILDDGRRPISVSSTDQRYNVGDCIAFSSRLFQPLIVVGVPVVHCGGAEGATTDGLPSAPYGSESSVDSQAEGTAGGPY